MRSLSNIFGNKTNLNFFCSFKSDFFFCCFQNERIKLIKQENFSCRNEKQKKKNLCYLFKLFGKAL